MGTCNLQLWLLTLVYIDYTCGRKIQDMKSGFLCTFLLALLTFSACKKEKSSSIIDPPGGDTTVTPDDKLKDTAIAYSRDIYLWNTHIPDTFKTQDYADPDAIMVGIRKYSIEPGFTLPVDHYSFAAKQSDWNDISSGVAQDFGLNIFFKEDGDLRVRFVEPLSPAGLAGIRRGWKITKINSSTDISYANAEYIVDNVYSSTSSTITFLKPDGNSVEISLEAGTYNETPVYLDSVYTVGAKKVGYLVFTSFLGDTVAVYNKLQQVFSRFTSSGVTDVVVDIRYNGGGYVNVSQKLADFLVKSSADGQTMMTQKFNDNYTDYNETTKFSKAGSLNVNNIYFIVGGNTASASELLVNNLKPYMNVKMVGSKTYGKPVGFFPIDDGDWYIFPVSFRSTNSNGDGNYFDGIAVDKEVEDGLDKDFGDVDELQLKSVLAHVNTGSFGYAGHGTALNSTLATQLNQVNRKLVGKSFVGAVGSPKAFRK
jgi:carboxyl-terminal processing protease